MADNNGSPYRQKISITLPNEQLEILDSYCRYNYMTRSAAISFLLAQAMYSDYQRTNGFDFDSVFEVVCNDDGSSYTIKRKDISEISSHWSYVIGKSKQGKFISVSSDMFDDIDEDIPGISK